MSDSTTVHGEALKPNVPAARAQFDEHPKMLESERDEANERARVAESVRLRKIRTGDYAV
ncbi:MAG: hypothetical protein H0X64_14830 [Gemmatimonadaceae bacterium]|nr:hypothetical protein [Gemmatimonadaceae bacterium]